MENGSGTILESLSFEASGETANDGKPAVLSCGGIHVPQTTVPTDLKSWQQIVNLPGAQLSAKIFGFSGQADPLDDIIRKEILN